MKLAHKKTPEDVYEFIQLNGSLVIFSNYVGTRLVNIRETCYKKTSTTGWQNCTINGSW